MRINFFSIILIFLIVSSVTKISLLFDRAMQNYANIGTRISTVFEVASANASAPANDTLSPADKDLEVEKLAKDAKDEKHNLVEHKQDAKKTIQDQSDPSANNLLSVGFTTDEIKLLQELSKRREELDQYQQQLLLKDNLIKATEVKLDTKILELKSMEDRINSLMAQLDAKSSMRIKSLAKIYENMKPQDAAKIFDELEMPILLEIIRNMKEMKVAPVIAQMNPQKAKDVSLEFTKISDDIENIKK